MLWQVFTVLAVLPVVLQEMSGKSEKPEVTEVTGCGAETCKAEACAIQKCLKRKGYDESGCTALIDALYECCHRFYADSRNAAVESTVCCPKRKLLGLKMEQRRQEQLDAELYRKYR